MKIQKKPFIAICLVTIIISGALIFRSRISDMILYFTYKNLPFKRCMSIGNALEAPRGIPWDVEMRYEYFDVIKEAGFDSVRLPVRFSDYTDKNNNYVLDEDFMKKIDSYIDYALNDDLTFILDFHHFVEIMENPEENVQCFLSIWNQLSDRYKDYSDKLIFEILNEPHDNLEGVLWNEYLNEGVSVIRNHDKNRKIIIGPDRYNSVDRLYKLQIPDDDNLILTFHYYEPNEFTFQGNIYHEGYENLRNISWTGTEEERKALINKFDIAKKYSRNNRIPVFLGEFGANVNAKEQYRKLWTESVRREAEDLHFAWGYWEFCSAFGIYDEDEGKWDENMLKSLIPDN